MFGKLLTQIKLATGIIKFWYVVFIFDAHQRCANWTDLELRDFALLLKKHKIKYVRIAPEWFDPKVKPPVPTPFLRSLADPAKWDLDRPNPAYNAALLRFKEFLNRKGVEVWFDLFDNCGNGRPWSAWIKNVNGVHGIYEYNDNSIAYYKKWINRIFGILGKRSHYGLGNELTFPAWQNVTEANKWGEKWVLGLATYLRSLGARYPLSFSADMSPGGTQSRIIGWLTEVGNWGGRFGERLIHVIHGLGLPEHWDEVWASNVLSGNVGLGMDEDGVGMGARIIPPLKRGTCEEPGIRCGVSRYWFVQTAKRMFQTRGVGKRLRIIVRMPKEVAMSYKPISDIDENNSLAVFDDITAQV